MQPAGLIGLCDPALYYLLISVAIIIVIASQNYGQGYNYCVGTHSCPSSHVSGLFALKVLYVLLWTWILNLICKNGSETLSWILVLFPIVLMFVFIAFYFSNQYDFGLLFQLPNLFN